MRETLQAKPKIIICKGVAAAGKTTWAKGMIEQLPKEFRRVNKDDIRTLLGHDLLRHNDKDEQMVLKVRDETISMLLGQGFSVICDDTNLHPRHEKRIRELFSDRADIEVKMFHVDLAEAIARDLKRPKSVGEKVIRQQYKQMIQQNETEVPVILHNPNLKNAIICDLDGTLCLMGKRSPYDASTCEDDTPNEPVVQLVLSMHFRGYEVIFMSGREEKYRDQTVRWLNKTFGGRIPYHGPFMRATDDFRNDATVKIELYKENIENKFNVIFCVDDRTRVVDALRSVGLTVLQVADGNF